MMTESLLDWSVLKDVFRVPIFDAKSNVGSVLLCWVIVIAKFVSGSESRTVGKALI